MIVEQIFEILDALFVLRFFLEAFLMQNDLVRRRCGGYGGYVWWICGGVVGTDTCNN